MAAAGALVAGVAALGVLLAVSAWTNAPAARSGPSPLVAWWVLWWRPIVAGAVAGAVGVLFTGWLIGGLAVGALALLGVRAWQRRGSSRRMVEARIDGLAAWCEQLRDLLSADQGLVSTIDATVRTCPSAIRPAVARLAVGLERQSPSVAVGRFADELDDPSADLVASVLVLAMSRSSHTAEMLSGLAATMRERASMQLRVEAERAGTRSEARFVVGFTAVVVVGVIVFGQGSEFLAAYDDAAGQLVLFVVAAMFGVAGWWLLRLGRFQRPERFLTGAGDEVVGS